MGDRIRELAVKYREQWTYILVGCGTTAVNYAVYVLLNALGVHYLLANVCAWVGAVTFAYFANGAWVYRSTAHRGIREAAAFALSRLFSLGLETVLLYLLVDVLHRDKNITKLLVQVLVIAVNYLTGRVVYRAGREREE